MMRLVFNVRDPAGKAHLMSAVVHGELEIQPFEADGPQSLDGCHIGAFVSAEVSWEEKNNHDNPRLLKLDHRLGMWNLTDISVR